MSETGNGPKDEPEVFPVAVGVDDEVIGLAVLVRSPCGHMRLTVTTPERGERSLTPDECLAKIRALAAQLILETSPAAPGTEDGEKVH